MTPALTMEAPRDEEDKRVSEESNRLREMLASSLALRQEVEDEKMVRWLADVWCVIAAHRVFVLILQVLQEKLHKLEELCRRKEKSIQVDLHALYMYMYFYRTCTYMTYMSLIGKCASVKSFLS